MNYKKKLKSSKKIKGGTRINESIAIKFAAYVLANILMEYYVEIYIWCENFYTSSRRNDITDDYLNNFIREYSKDSLDIIYRQLIVSESYSRGTTFSNVNISIFLNSIYDRCKTLLNWYRSSNTTLDDMLKKNILSVLYTLKLSYPDMVISTDNTSLNYKLINMCALYCIAYFYKEDFTQMHYLNQTYGANSEYQLNPSDYSSSFLKLYDSLKYKFEKKNSNLTESMQYFDDQNKENSINLIIENVYTLAPNLSIYKNLMALFISIYSKDKTKKKVQFVIRKLHTLISIIDYRYSDNGRRAFDELYQDTIDHSTAQSSHFDEHHSISMQESDDDNMSIPQFDDDDNDFLHITQQPVTTQPFVRQIESQISTSTLEQTYRLFLDYQRYHRINTQYSHQSIDTQADIINQNIQILAATEQDENIRPVVNEKQSINLKIDYYKTLLRSREIYSDTKAKIEKFIADLEDRLRYLELQDRFNKKGMDLLSKKKKNIESCDIKVSKDIMTVYEFGNVNGNKANESACRSWNSEVHGTRLVKISKKNSDIGKHNCYDIYGLIDNLYNKANLYLPQLDIYDMFEKTIYTFDEFKNLFKTIYDSYSDYLFEKKYEILFVLVTLSDADLKKLYEFVKNKQTQILANEITDLYEKYNFQYYAYTEHGDYIASKSYWYQNIQKVNAILQT